MPVKYISQIIKEGAFSCLLCTEAECTKKCLKGVNCASIISSLRFENFAGAFDKASKNTACLSCTSKECEKNCRKAKITQSVPIQRVISSLLEADASEAVRKYVPMQEGFDADKVDLSIDFMGVHFENPFLLSSSVVGSNYEMLSKAFDQGWAGVAFKTVGVFVPDEVSPRFGTLAKESNTFVGFKNLEQISDHSLEENLECFRKLKKDYPSKVIIASIMGRNDEEWEYLAKVCEEAGADILEANFSCPQMAEKGTGSDVGQNPELVAQYCKAIRRGSKLPLLAKMTPNLGNMEVPAIAAINAGAEGIAAINTVKSILGVELDDFTSCPSISGKTSVGGYSGKAVKPVALRFINDMKQCSELKDIPVSGMGGIETWKDAAEFMALGCRTIQVTTAVMQYGYRIIYDMIDGMKRYLFARGFKSVEQIIGKALPQIIPADKLDRRSRQFPKFISEKCVGCGRCVTSCFDGGHQALSLSDKGRPVMNKKCVGCHLCILVCPSGAIVPGSRTSK